ncbi:MAG: hypothetical protein ABGX16_12765, partial [Pirellulales bacterium]
MTMLQPWTGPYGGVPPWNLVQPDDFVAAFDAAIELADEEIEAISDNSRQPSFENTLVAIEKVGRPLDRLETLFGVHTANLNVGPIADIEKIVMPKLAAFHDPVVYTQVSCFGPNASHAVAKSHILLMPTQTVCGPGGGSLGR